MVIHMRDVIGDEGSFMGVAHGLFPFEVTFENCMRIMKSNVRFFDHVVFHLSPNWVRLMWFKKMVEIEQSAESMGKRRRVKYVAEEVSKAFCKWAEAWEKEHAH